MIASNKSTTIEMLLAKKSTLLIFCKNLKVLKKKTDKKLKSIT